MEINLLAAVLGFLLTSAILPHLIRAANRYQWFDHPDGVRRFHERPIPRLGGVAVYIGAGITILVVMVAASILDADLPGDARLQLGIALGAAIVFLTGLLDDIRPIPPIAKLIAQSAAAAIVISYGLRAETVYFIAGYALNVGDFAIPMLGLWIVGMTNAFNLIDGVDGLAGSFAILALLVCIALSAAFGASNLVAACAVLGATVAFLRVNRSPARIFLGDCGSMTLGYFLAIQAVLSATDASGSVYALVPLFVLAYPVLDTAVAIARRWLRGHPLSRADGRHIHHQLLALGISPPKVVQALILFFAVVAGAGLSLVFAPPQLTLTLFLIAGIAAAGIAVYSIRYLNYLEFIELGQSVVSVLKNARSVVRDKILAQELASRIEQSTSTQEVETLLHSSVGDLRLLQIDLLPSDPHVPGPEAQMFAPPDRLPFRLEYRLGWEAEGERREMILRLWCPHPPGAGHANAERVAAKLGPALERWVRKHPEAFSGAVHVARPRRSSGQLRAHSSDS